MNTRDLKYFEQRVNNRFGTSAAPAIDASLLPETATDVRLQWRRIPIEEVSFFDDGSDVARDIRSALCEDGYALMPVHPFEVDRWPNAKFIESGSISVSASYRTMFFEPDAGGLLSNQVTNGMAMMLKMHLERPLPGIPGDRRLTRKIIEKCVALSPVLQSIMRANPLGHGCEIIPEFLGLSNDETGVIFRQLPAVGAMPLFSLFSPDPELADGGSYIESKLRRLYGDDAAGAAADLGEQLARPLLRPLLLGFREGFSLELHAQNVVFQPGESTLIDRVFIRDMEGVIFSNRYRAAQGLEPLFTDYDNNALVSDYSSMTRWFNRNVDHDIGRVFTATLNALVDAGYFSAGERAIAVRSIRTAMRQSVTEARVGRLNLPGRVLPISRSPYGNGLSKGHWYRSRYR
jgi:hypothetical protein